MHFSSLVEARLDLDLLGLVGSERDRELVALTAAAAIALTGRPPKAASNSALVILWSTAMPRTLPGVPE